MLSSTEESIGKLRFLAPSAGFFSIRKPHGELVAHPSISPPERAQKRAS